MITITFSMMCGDWWEGKEVRKINKKNLMNSARLLLPTGGQTPNPLVILRRRNQKNKTTRDGNNFQSRGVVATFQKPTKTTQRTTEQDGDKFHFQIGELPRNT
jgi:hypothetical protein